eukprot:PRCOL_00006362-RA
MGAYLDKPERGKDSGEGANGAFAYGFSSMQGWRRTQEDAHAAVVDLDGADAAAGAEETGFFAVYDGHGGAAVARYCARHLHAQLRKCDAYKRGDHGIERDEDEGKRACNSSAGEGGDDEEGIYVTPPGQTVATADDLLPPTTGGLVSGPAAGCTAVVAVVRGNSLVVANCGDSRCVLSRGGAAVALSRDHKPEDPEELKRIEKAKCFVADGRVNGVLNLSRAIGDSEFKQSKEVPAAEQAVTAMPEIMTQTLRLSADASEGEDADALDEFLVLGCDGIFDVKTNQEVVDFVREQLAQGTGLREAAEALLDDCLAPDCGGSGVGCDNMSAVVVTFGTQAQAFPGGEHAERLKASGGAKVVGGSSGADGGGLPPLASALSMTRR